MTAGWVIRCGGGIAVTAWIVWSGWLAHFAFLALAALVARLGLRARDLAERNRDLSFELSKYCALVQQLARDGVAPAARDVEMTEHDVVAYGLLGPAEPPTGELFSLA